MFNKTKFQWLKSKHPNWYSIIVGASLIMFWRLIWDLLDMYFLPDNHLLSVIIPGVLGLILLYVNDFKLKEIE